MAKTALSILVTLMMLSGTALAEESMSWSNSNMGLKMNLPGAKWIVTPKSNGITGWSKNGLTAFVLTRQGQKRQTLKQALVADSSVHKQRFSFVSPSHSITCGARNGFSGFCYQRYRGFIESSGWSAEGEMIIFSTRVGSKLITGAVFSAEPIHARHYVQYMLNSLARN